MPKVSVIVPVYNTEKYLEKCLDSLIAQTLKDIEVICINDCSTDDSLAILQKYAANDDRIKVIDFKENKGAAAARNAGIDKAQGEYLGFVDSDDYVDLDFYEKLYTKAIETGADAVKGEMCLDNDLDESRKKFYDINKLIKVNWAFFCHSFTTAIYKRDFLLKNDIRFPEHLRCFEDPYFSINAAFHYQKLELIEGAYYHYIKRDNSIVQSYNEKTAQYDLQAAEELFDLLTHQKITPTHRLIVNSYIADNLKIIYNNKKFSIASKDRAEKLLIKANKENMLLLKNLIDEYDVISFDIFDTLLLRPFLEPTDLFLYMEHLNKVTNFFKDRIMAEKSARLALKLKHSPKEDVTYDEIYKRLDAKYPFARSQELELEEQFLTANKEMLEIYNYAKAQNKKIIIVSDMYLPSSFLTKVLNKNGYTEFEKLYVSSETGVCKCSGKMFEYILNDLHVKPEKILHIGDNMNSDVEKPANQGMGVFQYEQIKKRFLKNDCDFNMISLANKSLATKFLYGAYVLLEFHDGRKGWEKFAYEYGGMLLFVFASIIKQIADARKLTDLLFVARDGYLIKKAYEILFPDSKIGCHYVYASRKVFSLYKNGPISSDNEYFKYIQSLEIKGNKLGIVDTCAETFSAQKLLQRYLGDKDYIGIYLASFMNYEFNYINLTGYRHSVEAIGFSWDLIETLLSSPEPPIEDIKDCKPVYRSNLTKADQTNMSISVELEKGMIDFIKDIKNLYGHYEITDLEYCMKDVFDRFKYMWDNMNPETVNLLSQVEHPTDIGQNKYLNLLAVKETNA